MDTKEREKEEKEFQEFKRQKKEELFSKFHKDKDMLLKYLHKGEGKLDDIVWSKEFDTLDVAVKVRPIADDKNEVDKRVKNIFEKFKNKINEKNSNFYFVEALNEKNLPLVVWLAQRNHIFKCFLKNFVNEMKYCEKKSYECIEKVLNKQQINLIAKRINWGTILKDMKCMKLLINLGVNPDIQDEFGDTILIKVVVFGNLDFINLLINKGVNVNLQNKKGKTALMVVTSQGDYPNVVQLLIDNGADVNIKDNEGQNTLSLIRDSNRGRQILEILKQAGANE